MPHRRLPSIALYVLLITAGVACAQSTPAFTNYSLVSNASAFSPQAITSGPDGALWFSGLGIGRITSSGVITTFPVPSIGSLGIVAGSDSALWLTDWENNAIGRMTTAGVFTEFNIPTPASYPARIAAAPDGALWFTELNGNKIGRISTSGVFTEYAVPNGNSSPCGITVGPDGALWFTEATGSKIGRITTSGQITEYPAPVTGLLDITTGPDGALWFTGDSEGSGTGRITTVGVATLLSTSGGKAIITGPDGALWFTEKSSLSRIATTGAVTTYMIPAIIPGPSGLVTGPDKALWIAQYYAGIERVGIVTPAPLQLMPNLGSGTVGVPYAFPIYLTGGAPPFTWAITSGSLPAGLSLLSLTAGGGLGPQAWAEVSGTPTVAGTQTFTIQVTDADSNTASQTVSVIIDSANCSYDVETNAAFTATGGGPGFITITAPNGCPWAVTGPPPPSWVTFQGPASGSGNATLVVYVTPNLAPPFRSWSVNIAGYPALVTETGLGSAGIMPHLAAEGGWNTTFTLVNKDPSNTGEALVNLLDDNGNPLSTEIVLPQQPAIGPVTESSANRAIAPSASYVAEATGPPNVPYVEGSAQILGTSNIDGFAIFHYDPSGQEAVVPLQSEALPQLLAFDNTNGVLTGVALAGYGTYPVILRDDTGAQIGTGTESITLPMNGHTSFVLSTQYPVTANIRGTIQIGQCLTAFQPLSVNSAPLCNGPQTLGIRYTPPGTLTTIPPLYPYGTGPGQIAHIAAGGGWQTTFVLTNPDASPGQGTLNFFGDDGAPLALALTFPQTGETLTASSLTRTIAPGASLWIQSAAPSSAAVVGSAQFSNTGYVTGYAIFRYNPNGQEAVVPFESRGANSYLLAFDNTSGTATGVAISAKSSQPVSLPIVLRDDSGNQLTTSTVQLQANGHASFILAQQFPQTAGIRGTVEVDAPTGATISVLGIRSPPALTFTTLPALLLGYPVP